MNFLRAHVSLGNSGCFQGFTDWHSHILPCVDDGVQTLEESLAILRSYEELGVKTVWLTPHIMEDVPNATDTLRQRFEELQSAYEGSIVLHLAAENMIDSLFETRLETNDLLPIGDGGDHLLVETSYFNPPMGLHHILHSIKQKGYFPILAHPERYIYMTHSSYHELKAAGVKLQLNIFSLVGFYGTIAKKKAEWLLKNEMYDICGSDIHSIDYLKASLQQKMRQHFAQSLRSLSAKDKPNI